MKLIKYIDLNQVLRAINSHKKIKLENEDVMFNIALEIVEKDIKQMSIYEVWRSII